MPVVEVLVVCKTPDQVRAVSAQALAAEAMLERLQTRWRRLGALVEFGMWGVLIEHDPNEAWADDGAALTALLDSPAVATEADQCERALRPNVQGNRRRAAGRAWARMK